MSGNEFSYYFFSAMALLQVFGAGFAVANVGKPTKPTGPAHAITSMIFAVMYLIACSYMVKP